jgi:ABC-2 type transport system ATP-binding protein
LIEASHLTKDFGTLRAVDDVTFSVARGRIAGFLGPNGAGKTTTMRILTGIFPPNRGRARIAGFDLQEQPMEARRRLGYFPENAPYYADATVTGFLDFVGKMKGLDTSERKRRAGEMIEACGLGHVAERLVGTLSKGTRQRVGLAQALLGDPEVLILDEPTVGLDPEQVSEIRGLIKALKGERTILLSSHILSEVSLLCEEVIVLHRGRVVAQDSPERLAERLRPSHRVTLRVEAPTDAVVGRLGALDGVLSARPDGGRITLEARDEATLREISRTLQSEGWLLLEMKHEALALEDIFLSLVRGESERSPDASA